ncbi:MAG: hypothetical protein V1806_16090 [Pseudomonadota bacterium]
MNIQECLKKPLLYNWLGFVVLVVGLLAARPLLPDWAHLKLLKDGGGHWWYAYLSALIVGAVVIFGVLPCSRFGPPAKIADHDAPAAPGPPAPKGEG